MDHISKNETRHFDVIMVLKNDTHDEIQFDVRMICPSKNIKIKDGKLVTSSQKPSDQNMYLMNPALVNFMIFKFSFLTEVFELRRPPIEETEQFSRCIK